MRGILTILLIAALPVAAQYYEYDAAGRLTAVAYSEGGGIRYSYDAADNLLAATPVNFPAFSLPGQFAMHVTWTPPSYTLPF